MLTLKSLLIFAIFFLLSNTVTAQQPFAEINIQDNALKLCIKNHSEKYQWQFTSQFTKLKCHGKGIINLSGLENFSQLSWLSLFNNKISSADLSQLTQLTHLNIANNKLTTINIKQLSKLKTLYLFKNKLTTINFAGLTQLNKMRITNNILDSLELSPLISLEKAYLFDNKLEDLTVKHLPKLRFIELRQNPMPDEVYDRYDAIAGMTIIHDGNADDWK